MSKRHYIEIIILFLYYTYYAVGFFITGDIDKHWYFVSRYLILFATSVFVLSLLLSKSRNKPLLQIGYLLSFFMVIVLITMLFRWLRDEGVVPFIIDTIGLIFWFDLAKSFMKFSDSKK